jgi:hypothetical protein
MVAKRLLLYVPALLIAAGLTGFVFLEPILNAPPVKTRIVRLIEIQTGVRIDPARLTFLLTPQPGIQVAKLVLPLTRDIDLTVDTVHLDLDLRALLKKKIQVSRVSLKELSVRTDEGAGRAGMTFHDPLVFQYPKEQMTRMFALLPDSGDQLQILLENSATPEFSRLTGSLMISKTDQTLQFDAQIQDLHATKKWLSRFFSAPDFRVDRLRSADARLHVRLNAETGITGHLGLGRFEIFSPRLTTVPVSGNETRMHFSYLPDQVSFHLDTTSLTYPSAQVSMAFSNNPAHGKTVLTFQGRQVDISQAREASLALGSDSQVVRELFDILRRGTASDVSVGFHADSWNSLFDPRHLTLEGTAEKARVKIPATPLTAEDVNGTARVSDGVLTIQTDTGTVERSHMHKGSLSIDLLHPSHVPFTGDFDLDVDLAEVPAVLARLLPDTRLAEEMARVSGLTGRARARLGLAVDPGQPDLLVSVATQPFSATGLYDRIPLPLSVSRAVFVYEKDEIQITGLSGTMGHSRVTGADARISIAETPHLDLVAENMEIDIQEVWPKLYAWEPFHTGVDPVKQMAGHLRTGSFQYNGPMFEWTQGEFDIAGTGRDIRIGFTSEPHEILDLAGGFHVSESRISLSDLTARVMDLDWLSDRIPFAYTSGIVLPVSVAAGAIDFADRRLAVAGQALLAPNVRLAVQLTGNGPDDLKPDLVHLEHKPLTDAVIRFNDPLETGRVRFEGRLDTRTLETFLDKESFILQRLASLTRGEPVEIISKDADDLKIHTRRLKLDTLFSVADGLSFFRDPPRLFWKNLLVHIDRLEYKALPFSDLDVRISWDPHHPDIVLQTADFCGVDLSGRMGMDLISPGRQAVAELKISALNRENIASLLSCVYPETDLMDGRYSLEGGLSGTGSLKTLHTGLAGNFFLESENGRIHKMTLLSRLLSVLNILKLPDIRQEGFRYHTIQVNAKVKNGVIHLENAVIDAENMALFFTGEVYPFENRLDLTCLVAPFKTIDTIVQFIPVVNTILEGRLVSFPAKAAGPIGDPVITPLHPSAVGEGLINMFTSLLQSPARLLEKVP